jgi:transposase
MLGKILIETDLEKLPDDKVGLQNIINSLVSKNQELSSQFLDFVKKNESLSKAHSKLSDECEYVKSKFSIVEQENKKLLFRILQLEDQLKLLRKKQFGSSSEKVNKEINKQIESLEQQIEEAEISLGIDTKSSLKEEDKDKEKKKPRRQKTPDSIPREDIIVEAPEKCSECGGDTLRQIGEDTSEVLEYSPASFKVLRYIRPRCVCKKCEAMNQAHPVSKGIDKGKAGFGLLAHVMVQKYCNHLPLYRQSQIYARESITISRPTMSGWVGQCSKLLDPLIEELRRTIFSADKIHGDDTTIKVLEPGRKKTKTGRIWTYVLDGRDHGDNTPPAVCYYYSPDRKGERPEKHLENFKGIFQADAYAGYNGVYSKQEISEAGCWAHVRRKFYEITVVSDNAKIAYEAIEQIRKLYKIEEQARGKSPEERLKIRQEHSKELVTTLFECFKKSRKKLFQKGSTAKAINYALNQEEVLKRFLDDGRIEIDNNIAERAMRSIAVGRKNWMFAGSDRGGETAANIYSLIETAKLNNINPWTYLKKVLSVIQDYNSQKLHELLPWNIQLE